MNAQRNLLREYLDVLVRRWRVTLGVPALAILAAGLFSSLSPTVYETTALIVLEPSTLSVPTTNLTMPYYLIVESSRELPFARTPAFYVELLKSAELVAIAAPQLPVTIAPSSSDRSMIEVTVRGGNPVLVAQTANRYADVGAQYITKLLIPKGEQAATAQAKLETADAALAQFSRENGLGEYDLAKLRSVSALAYEKKMELARLLRSRDVAETVYLELARDQTRAAIVAVTSAKPLAIQKPPSTVPVAPKPLESILSGALLGLLLGVLGSFLMENLSS